VSETYEEQAEGFCAELAEEQYQNGAGLKETCDLSAIYERHAGLFARERVEELLGRRETRAGSYLAQFGAFEYLGNSVRALTEGITNAETQATLQWDGEEVSYRFGSVLLSNEADFGRRRELHRRLLAVIEEKNPERAERVARQHAEARSLGFPDYVRFCEELAGLRLGWLAGEMKALLARTESRWRAELETALEQAEIPPQEADVADLRYLLGAPQFDALFPKEKLLAALEETLLGLGLELRKQENLRLDTEERPLKSPRAFCAPVRVPSDVRLVIMPRGGREDYSALLHEAGHAEHFAHTEAAAPFAFRYLGDSSVTESYAFLLDHLLRSPAWLREVMGIQAEPGYLRFTRFYQLYYLRRYAAKLAYELELHAAESPGEGFGERYSRELGEALGVKAPGASYLADVDDGFYCACYLRAWVFEAQLRERLEHEFGRAWFRQPRCGELLRWLWRLGQKYTVEELAQQLGYPGLEAGTLIGELV
jgi:hypothetical protein